MLTIKITCYAIFLLALTIAFLTAKKNRNYLVLEVTKRRHF